MFNLDQFSISTRIAAIYLVMMCIQLIPLEGMGVSNLKVAAMAFALPITFWKVPNITRATWWLALYLGAVLFSAVIWNSNFRSSTIIYLFLCLMTFNMYYSLVYSGAFTIDFFLRLIKGLIYAYVAVLLLQQMAILIGIRSLPAINLVHFLNRGIGANSLALEPSHSARILAVAFYAFLKVSEIRQGKPLSVQQLLIENLWLTLGFLYAMVTLGSGTAFVALAVIGLYFMRPRYALLITIVGILLYIVIPQINYEPLNRSRAAIEIAIQGDTQKLKKADGSAASRINPILNTWQNLDLSLSDTWFGKGSDTGNQLKLLSEKQMMGNINDYGLLSFVIGIILILICCVTRIFSVNTLLIFILVGFTVNNIIYIWGIYMLFVPVKYFYLNYATNQRNNPRHLRL